MNKNQNDGESFTFLQCEPCRGYPYVGLFQDIRSSSTQMYYYIVVLKKFPEVTGMHLH